MIKQNESFLKVLNTFFELLFSGITTVFLFGFNKYIIIFYIVTSILIIGFSIFSWNKTKFLIEDEIFIFENLVFNRTILKIPFSSIVSVDTTQSIKQKIFGVNIFKVNTVNKDEDIQLLLSNKNSKKLKELLMKSETKKEEIEEILKVSVFENFIFSMSNRDLIVSTTVWLLIIFYGFEYAVEIFEIKTLNIKFLFLVLAFLVIERVVTGIFGFVKYYGFNISKIDNNFRVNCGLFDEKKLTLDEKRITSVSIEQNIFYKIINKYKVSVSFLGKEAHDISIILPIIKKGEMEKCLIDFFPSFCVEFDENDISQNHKLLYKKVKYAENDDLTYFYKNLINKKVTIIKNEFVNSIEYKQNFINKIKNTKQIKIDFSGIGNSELRKINGVDKENRLKLEQKW